MKDRAFSLLLLVVASLAPPGVPAWGQDPYLEYWLGSAGASGSAPSAPAAAECSDPDPVPKWNPPAWMDTLPEKIKQELDSNYVNWVDANFLFDSRKQKDALELVSSPSVQQAMQNGEDLRKVWRLYNRGIGTQGLSLTQYLEDLKSQGRRLPVEQRLLLLSLWGEKLGLGYDQSLPNGGMSLAEIFRNAQLGGAQGGVCRHIHDLVQEMAKALGFEATGQHSGNWKQGNSTGAHAVAHYRDPTTGLFYMQNYSSIVNTGQTTIQEAVDVSTRILGPLSTTSAVETVPGRVHLYQPRTARWVRQQIEGQAFAKNVPVVTLNIGNRVQSVGLQAQVSGGKPGDQQSFKLFGFHTNFMGAAGDTQLSAVGASYEGRLKTRVQDSWLSEMGAGLQAYGGYQRFETPKLEPDPQDHEREWSRDNMFFGGSIDGYARFADDQVTGYTRLELSSTDFDPVGLARKGLTGAGSIPYNQITAGVQVGRDDSPLSARISRNWEVTASTINESEPTLRTRDDSLSIRAVLNNASKTAFVESESRLYAFGGIDELNATALSQRLRAAANLDSSSQLFVQGWAYQPLSNQSGDPFYDTGRAFGVEAGYMKQFESGLRFMISGGAMNGTANGMVDSEWTTPDVGRSSDETEYYVMFSMGMTIGPSRRR